MDGEIYYVLKELLDEVKELKKIIIDQGKKLIPTPPKHPKGFCGNVDCHCNDKRKYISDGMGR